MTPTATVALTPVFRKASVRDATVLLAMAAALPLLVHLLPSWDTVPLGAHLLAMFWVTFVAAYFYGAGAGALIGLVSPLINLLFTSLPSWGMIAMLGCELVVFALVASWLVRRAPRSWLIAPLAVLVALVAGAGLQMVIPLSAQMGTPARFLAASLTTGIPGLVVLTAINLILVKTHPKR